MAVSNEVITVGPLGASLATSKPQSLVKADRLEVFRLVLQAGKELPTHAAPGEITVHCLEGRAAFTAVGETRELGPGQMIYLAAREPHSVKAIEDVSLLVTKVLDK